MQGVGNKLCSIEDPIGLASYWGGSEGPPWKDKVCCKYFAFFKIKKKNKLLAIPIYFKLVLMYVNNIFFF